MLRKMEADYNEEEYDFFFRNCNHFAEAFCQASAMSPSIAPLLTSFSIVFLISGTGVSSVPMGSRVSGLVAFRLNHARMWLRS